MLSTQLAARKPALSVGIGTPYRSVEQRRLFREIELIDQLLSVPTAFDLSSVKRFERDASLRTEFATAPLASLPGEWTR